MSKVARLNREQQRVQVYTLRQQGLSWGKIAKQTKKTRATVFKMVRRVKENKGFKEKPRSGRPRKLSERDNRKVVSVLRKSPKKSLEAVRKVAKADHKIDVSRYTIRRILRSSDSASRHA